MGSPRLAWRPLALLVTDGGPGGDLGGPPPGGSVSENLAREIWGGPVRLAAGIASYVPARRAAAVDPWKPTWPLRFTFGSKWRLASFQDAV